MCCCGKPGDHAVPDPTPWSIALAGLLLLSGRRDGRGRFRDTVDPDVVRRNARFLRNFAEARAASTKVVRIRSGRDDGKVKAAACELIAWLDAVDAVYAPLSCAVASGPVKMSPPG